MAVIWNGAGNTTLNTANGFYRVEASNLGMFSNTVLILSTKRYANLEFANACDCLGFGVSLAANTSYLTACDRDVVIELEENSGYPTSDSWSTVATKTLTAAQINNSSEFLCGRGDSGGADWVVEFLFAAGYTVDNSAVASGHYKYRVSFAQSGGTIGNWYTRTSNGTIPFYAAFGDNAVTFSDNDTILCSGTYTITQDKDATLRGTLGTGDTTYSLALLTFRSSSPLVANVARFLCGAYALTCDGMAYCSAQSGVRAGTAASPISGGSWTFNSTPTYGTKSYFWSRFRSNLFFFGTVPTYEYSPLTLDVLVDATATMSIASPCVVTKSSHGNRDGTPCSFTTTGALPTGVTAGTVYYIRSIDIHTFHLYDTYAHAIDTGSTTGRVDTSGTQSGTHTIKGVIITDDAVDWVNGDTIYLDKQYGGAAGTIKTYTVDSVSGNQVLVTTAITQKIVATSPSYVPNGADFYKGYAVRLNGYGYSIAFPAHSQTFSYPANLQFSGCQINNLSMGCAGGTGLSDSNEDDANLEASFMTHCSLAMDDTFSGSTINFSKVPIKGFTASYVQHYRVGWGQHGASYAGGTFTLEYCNFFGSARTGYFYNQNYLNTWTMRYNRFLHGTSPGYLLGFGLTNTNNYYHGGNTGVGNFAQIMVTSGVQLSVLNWEYNVFEGANCMQIGYGINATMNADGWQNEFGGNYYIYIINLGANCKLLLLNPRGALNVVSMDRAQAGSFIRVENYNNTTGDYRSWYPEGKFVSSSSKLVASSFAPSTLSSVYNYGTGAVTGQKVYYSVNCIIADANYYIGTYSKPKMTVNYDTSSSEYDEATDSTSQQTLENIVTYTTDNAPGYISLATKAGSATATITSANPCVVTCATFAALAEETPIVFYSSGSLPSNNIMPGTVYYTKSPSGSTFNISDTPGGAAKSTAGIAQYGVHTAVSPSTVTWDSLKINQRQYGKVFATKTHTIDRTYDDPLAILTALSANSLITEATAATVGAYTGITINHSTQTVTIDENHSIAELYDYSQWDLCEDANMDTSAWLTSTDGITYESAYDIIVDGVNLNATGKIIDCGSNDFSLINGGTVTATRVTDVDGTSVSVFLDGVLNGSSYDVFDSLGNSVGSGTATGDVTINYTHTGDLAVTAVVRLFEYLEWTGSGTITVNGLTLNVAQVADLNTASYPAGVATDFTIVDDTSIAHTSGTTVYTTRQLYNYTMDYFADSAKCQVALPISAQTPFDFTLISPYTMSDATHEYIKGGSITEDGGDTLWAAVYTVGTIASGNIYVYQDSAEYTKYWGDGNIDILLKVKTGGTLIDSGNVTLLCREYSYTYDHYEVDLSGGGRVAVSLTTAADADNTTLEATIAGWSDITIATAGAPYSKDIGDGEGDCPYSAVVDAGGHAIQDVYERLKYIAEEGQAGEYYLAANAAYTEVKIPYGTFAGGIFFGARGIWVENVASADALNYVLIDNDNATHQAPSPPVNIEISGIVNGSRIQIYDTDTSTELLNEISTGTSSVEATAGHAYRYRIMYVDGTNAYEWLAGTGTVGASGSSFTVAQEVNATYETNNIDGSTVTECSISGATIRIYIDDPDNTTTAQRIYNWYQYYLFTEDGIAEQDGSYVSATDTTHYTFDNSMKIVNQDTVNPLNITGANIVPTSGAATNIFDLTNLASIALNFNRVEGFAYSSGSGLSTEEHDAVLATNSNVADIGGTVWDTQESAVTTSGSIGKKLKNGANASISSQ